MNERARELVAALRLARPDEIVAVRPLDGGVSSDIASVVTTHGTYCVKFALDRLRVKEIWTAPLSRNLAEFRWLSYVAAIDPAFVPRVLGREAKLGGFAMEYLDPSVCRNWKSELMGGAVDVAFAARVGGAIARVHRFAAADPKGRSTFPNQTDFEALRLDPYLRFTATKHPDISGRLLAIADALNAARISLVHGDVSPKNILKGPRGPIILDAECAVEGDPAFDIAFCLNHLLIKAIGGVAPAAALVAAASACWRDYASGVDWEPVPRIEARVGLVLPALMLARVDGKSPVEYLTVDTAARVRVIARSLIAVPRVSVMEIVERVANTAKGRS